MDQTPSMRFLWFHWQFINIIGILPKLTKSIFDKFGNQYLDLSLSPLKKAQNYYYFSTFYSGGNIQIGDEKFLFKLDMYMFD